MRSTRPALPSRSRLMTLEGTCIFSATLSSTSWRITANLAVCASSSATSLASEPISWVMAITGIVALRISIDRLLRRKIPSLRRPQLGNDQGHQRPQQQDYRQRRDGAHQRVGPQDGHLAL